MNNSNSAQSHGEHSNMPTPTLLSGELGILTGKNPWKIAGVQEKGPANAIYMVTGPAGL